jgi:hypothetical protein
MDLVETEVRCPKCGRKGVISYPGAPTNPYPIPETLHCPVPCGAEFSVDVPEHASNAKSWSVNWR